MFICRRRQRGQTVSSRDKNWAQGGEQGGEDALNIKATHKFDAPMPFNDEIWRVRTAVKEFAKPELYGDRIYTLEIADIEEAPVK